MKRIFKNKRPSRRQINIHIDWEVAYWTKLLDCTREELAHAVEKVGTSPVRVIRELGK